MGYPLLNHPEQEGATSIGGGTTMKGFMVLFRSCVSGLAAFLFFSALFFCSGAVSEADELKIGVIHPLSGPMALLGKISLEGSELARVEQNEKGGLLNKKIEFVVTDAPDAKAAVSAVDKLVTVDKVKVIMGSYSSGISFAASNVAEKYGVVYWELGAISDEITSRGFKYLFRTAPSASMMTYNGIKCMAEFLAPKMKKAPNETSVAMVYEDSLFGSSMAKYGVEFAKKYGMKVVADAPYNAKSSDLTSVILRLKAAKPDFLLYPGYVTDQMLFFRQAKELRFDFKAVIASGGIGLAEFGKGLAEDADGVGDIGYTFMDANPSFAKGIDRFIVQYEKLFSKTAEGYPLINYMGTKVLFAAIEKAKSMEPEAIRKAALSFDIPLGETSTGGGVKFDPGTGQNTRAVSMVSQWQNNGTKLCTVWPEEAASAKVIFPLPKWEERKKK
jgi:branched-chain amino acid transport system substrate-binding protein